MDAAIDHRGGSQSSFTEEMLQDIDDAVRNRGHVLSSGVNCRRDSPRN